jgi:predicted subunit of tRNA(5-methylaminomethyl-2-thiouridylate) methyltransferase
MNMNGKNSRLAATVLSALLYGQVALCLAAVTFVVLKDRQPAEPTLVISSASIGLPNVN